MGVTSSASVVAVERMATGKMFPPNSSTISNPALNGSHLYIYSAIPATTTEARTQAVSFHRRNNRLYVSGRNSFIVLLSVHTGMAFISPQYILFPPARLWAMPLRLQPNVPENRRRNSEHRRHSSRRRATYLPGTPWSLRCWP